MPGMSGISLAKKIKKYEEQKIEEKQQFTPIKIVAVTAAALKEEKDYYFKENILDGYIVKPIKITDLENVLYKIVSIK